MTRAAAIGLIALAGCGRFGFGAAAADAADASGAGGDDDASFDGAPAVDAQPTDPACAAASILCDGFESSSGASFPLWNKVELTNWQNGPLNLATRTSVVADGAYMGANVAAFVGSGAAQQAFLVRDYTPPAGATVYARAMIEIPSASTGGTFDAMGFAFDTAFVFFESDSDGTASVNTSYGLARVKGPGIAERDRWYCVELAVTLSPTNGSIAISIDGVPSLVVTGQTTPSDGYRQDVTIGVSTGAPETDTVLVNFDQVAASEAPIGCPIP